jgi:hypothetical protein
MGAHKMTTQIIIEGHDYYKNEVEDRTGLKWSPQEIEYLTQHYPTMNTRLISEYLGRSYRAVRTKALRLKLYKIRITKIVDYPEKLKNNKSYGVFNRIVEGQRKGGFL